jgi:hypothetical protein
MFRVSSLACFAIALALIAPTWASAESIAVQIRLSSTGSSTQYIVPAGKVRLVEPSPSSRTLGVWYGSWAIRSLLVDMTP